MSKSLIIAEKPSVAADISRSLGELKREKDYFENEDYVVTSAVGHLLEIKAPEGVEVKRGKWSFANLPRSIDSRHTSHVTRHAFRPSPPPRQRVNHQSRQSPHQRPVQPHELQVTSHRELDALCGHCGIPVGDCSRPSRSLAG
jgi:DNA topoisomerase IA